MMCSPLLERTWIEASVDPSFLLNHEEVVWNMNCPVDPVDVFIDKLFIVTISQICYEFETSQLLDFLALYQLFSLASRVILKLFLFIYFKDKLQYY